MFINVYGEEASKAYLLLTEQFALIQSYSAHAPIVRALESLCRQAAQQQIHDVYQAAGLAFETLMAIYHSAYTDTRTTALPVEIEDAIRYIKQNYANDLSIESIARKASNLPFLAVYINTIVFVLRDCKRSQ